MRNLLLILAFTLFTSISFSQVLLEADGPGDTYELINKTFAPGGNVIESPDAIHPEFADPNGEHRHIAEVWDTALNKYVFEFYIHVTPDNDPTDFALTDRQRNEIKTYAGSPDNLKGTTGEIFVVKWKFRLQEGFIPSSGFTHVHQVKAVGGDDGNPIFTLTPRKGSPDKMELLYAQSSSAVKLLTVDLELFSGIWVEAEEIIKIGAHGTYSIIIKNVSDNAVILSYSNEDIMTIRPDNDFIRPKWGIYRKFAPGIIRDETARFADFYIFDGTPPAAPANLVANVPDNKRIQLTWSDNSNSEESFHIQRSENDGVSWSDLDSVNANIRSYEDTNIGLGFNYLYRVRSANGMNYSAYSNVAAVWPSAPHYLSISAVTNTQLKLMWSDLSNNESLFRIQRSVDAGKTWDELTTVKANTRSYTDTGLNFLTTYHYQVRAENALGYSGFSDTISATTTDVIPVAPDNLIATAISNSQINLEWGDNSNNETLFRIMRSLDGIGGWASIATLGVNVNNFSISGLSANTTYFYRVRAENATGNSSYSNISSASTFSVSGIISGQGIERNNIRIFPNPAASLTNVEFWISEETEVNILIYDISGQVIKMLVPCESRSTGLYHQEIDVSGLKNGIYIVRFSMDKTSKTSKLIILK